MVNKHPEEEGISTGKNTLRDKTGTCCAALVPLNVAYSQRLRRGNIRQARQKPKISKSLEMSVSHGRRTLSGEHWWTASARHHRYYGTIFTVVEGK